MKMASKDTPNSSLHVIDWGRTDEEIAALIGCSVEAVQCRRRKMRLTANRSRQPESKQPSGERGARTSAPRRRRSVIYDWDSVDWSLPTRVITRRLGCSESIVSRRRRLLGKPSAPRVMSSRYDWDSVDWTRRDVEIAGWLGCSRERVRQVRQARGLPPSPRVDPSSKSSRIKAWMKRESRLSGALSTGEVREIFDCSRTVVLTAARRTGFRLRPPRLAYAVRAPINWDLPNRDLAMIWWPHAKWPLQKVGSNRFAYGRPSRWKGHRCPERDPAYRRALAAEKRKARRWRRTQGR
jgi:hypothetical protein